MRNLSVAIGVACGMSSAFALDANGFEKLARVGADATAQAVLSAYFQGVSETLGSQLSVNDGVLYYAGRKTICVKQEVLTPAMLRAVTENQVKLSAENAKVLGANWRSYNIATFTLAGLMKTFPCGG